MSRTRGLEKQGRIGRVKERKETGMGREVNKVSCSLLVGALWPAVHIRRRQGTKGFQLRPLGLVHWQASWPLSTPSGQDVSLGFFTNNDRFCAQQDVHRASRLPSTMPGLGLTLDFTRINTGVQRSLLLVRKPLLLGECYSSQLKGSWTSPQMLCPESESPKLRD